MKKPVMMAVLASVTGFAGSPALAKEPDDTAMKQQQAPMPVVEQDHLFEERAGTWKATCDEMEDSKVYCRMFHIEQFGEWKTRNFVQMGPAWTPDSVGFVVATYLGFKEGTIVTIGIDKHKRYEITAPKGNNLMIRPEIAGKILQEMENGHKIVVTFNSHSGVRHLSLTDLGPFNTLVVKVKKQMAKNKQPESAR